MAGNDDNPAAPFRFGFPNFRNANDLEVRWQLLTADLPLNTDTCNTPTLFERVSVPPELLVSMEDQNVTQAQRAGMIANWVTEYLSFSAARREALWLINWNFTSRAIAEIMLPEYNDITAWVSADVGVEECLPERVETYGTLSRRFRANLDAVLPLANFRSGGGFVPGELTVSNVMMNDMNDLLRSIINKRNARIGNQGRPAGAGQGCQHYESYPDFLTDANMPALLPLNRRSANGNGILGQYAGIVLAEEPAAAGGQLRTGFLLLTTAIAEYRRRNNGLPPGIRNRNEPEIVRALAELDTMQQNNIEQVIT